MMKTRSHIVLRLKAGWRFERARRRFVHDDGAVFYPQSDLPKYTRILFQVPDLLCEQVRTADEDLVARGLQVVPPGGKSAVRLLKRIERWPCVKLAWISSTPRLA